MGQGEETDDASRSDGGGGRVRSAFAPGGWFRRFAKLWGFLGFCVLVVFLARSVVLPFVFGLLTAYILAPLVEWLSTKGDGGKRMPRGLSIILCYIVFLALISVFVVALMPRLSSDVARIGSEAPALYKKLNDVWAPQVADWLTEQFPSLGAPVADPPPDVDPSLSGLPPATGFVVTPLPDGRLAVQLADSGLNVKPLSSGGFNIGPSKSTLENQSLEDRLRLFARAKIAGLQGEFGKVFKAGQAFVAGVVRAVFLFFLTLMIAAFILLDIKKIHGFVRGLVPRGYRDDYDLIARGIDRGLAGVIRGQLIICLVNGVLTYIGLVIFSVKYSLILAVVAAVLSLIPIFGSILSTIPIFMAALVSGDEGLDLARGLIMLAWISGIHFLEGNFLNPKIIGTAAKIHPVLVVFALVLGEQTYGLVGALLAVPALSIVQVLFIYFRSKAWRNELTGQHPTIEEV